VNLDEEKLRYLLSEDIDDIGEAQSLQKVLSDGKKAVALKDVASVFVGWVWVVFLGFGASLYSAKRRYQKHVSDKRLSLKLEHKVNVNKDN